MTDDNPIDPEEWWKCPTEDCDGDTRVCRGRNVPTTRECTECDWSFELPSDVNHEYAPSTASLSEQVNEIVADHRRDVCDQLGIEESDVTIKVVWEDDTAFRLETEVNA